MSEFTPETEFAKQFSGSAAANGLTLAILAVAFAIFKLCKRPSRCKSHFHSCCLDVSVSDRTIRTKPDIEAPPIREPTPEKPKNPKVPGEPELKEDWAQL